MCRGGRRECEGEGGWCERRGGGGISGGRDVAAGRVREAVWSARGRRWKGMVELLERLGRGKEERKGIRVGGRMVIAAPDLGFNIFLFGCENA